MVAEIIEQGGYFDKFISDAIMAVFRGDYHLERAIEVCPDVKKKVYELPNESGNVSYAPKVSIGINTSEIISGHFGSGKLRRPDYTVIGDTVNIAQRLQSTASEGQIISSEFSYEKIKDSFHCRKVRGVPLKNKTNPMTTYEVMG